MSRQPPSNIFVSGRPSQSDYQVLTPRTPHSRAGRAEEALSEVELDDLNDDERHQFLSYRQQQSQPLLAPSSPSSFPTTGYRSKGDDIPKVTSWAKKVLHTALARAPLALGSLLALVLLGAVLLSLKRPGTIEQYLGTSLYKPVPTPTPSYVDTIPAPGLLISYDNYTKFPLTGDQYLHACDAMMSGFMNHKGGYWQVPPGGSMDVKHHDDVTDYQLPEGKQSRVCKQTLTYQLDGHVGLLADLALMAQAAAHARESILASKIEPSSLMIHTGIAASGRTIFKMFVHDSLAQKIAIVPIQKSWLPVRGPQEIHAEILLVMDAQIVNSRTAKFHFGHAFSETYEDPYAHEVNRQKPIFKRALQSFIQTIRPNVHNARLIRAARTEVASLLSLPHPISRDPQEPEDAEAALTMHNPDPYIAVHIRKGDRHAAIFPYRGSYVPMDKYIDATQNAWKRLYPNDSSASREPGHYPSPPITYIASDSPAALKEFTNAFPTSTAVFSLDSSTDPELRGLASPREYVQSEFNQLGEEERILLTRGMIVDFALLSGLWAWEGEVVPGATVCTMSSSICKVAAVGLGWDRAFGFGDGEDHSMGDINDERKRWVEIDNKGTVSPEWKAFDLF
ncbi:hypothetical protein BXZ70DRAFT_1030725 [Cristinia sonorae]|uniref:Uncharacterized protein n=1 Tax=Cristinia sonorae TaxID=1940300 RepID=A0A8K0ULB2_9AGAR|nr:hypothetical protein BXZ70DRAFT_1030725 [Cristinia sonorae]